MASETAEQLFESAKLGRRLSPGERRRVLVFLDETQQTHSVDQLAEWFSVAPSVIRKDRQRLLQDYAAHIKPDAAMQFIARYMKEHDSLISKARTGMDAVDVGSMYHQNYIKLLSDLFDRQIKRLQEIGIIQKELGHLSVTEEVWEASVSEDGVTSVSKASNTDQSAAPSD